MKELHLDISMIERYGEVLTDKEYVTDPAIASDDEINVS